MLDDQQYGLLKEKIRRLLKIDLEPYKQLQMHRRLSTWVERHSDGDPTAFISALGGDKELLTNLLDTVTINVTEFFRDAPQFEALEHTVLPQLTRESSRLRAWSAGCSFGDEPYTLAILLDEMSRGRNAEIIATDIDPIALGRARAGGPYGKTDLKNVSAERRSSYFSEQPDGFYVTPTLRARIRFDELNLLSDGFDGGFDLILCRNVIIYFDGPAKTALIRRFRNALRPGGVLFIGATEALPGGDIADLESMRHSFYRRPLGAEQQLDAA